MALKVSTLSLLTVRLILDRHETTRAPEATEVLGPADLGSTTATTSVREGETQFHLDCPSPFGQCYAVLPSLGPCWSGVTGAHPDGIWLGLPALAGTTVGEPARWTSNLCARRSVRY